MDRLSFGSLVSMAAWPIAMNLPTLVSLFPAIERCVAQLNYEDLLRRHLDTWTAYALLAAAAALGIATVACSAWKQLVSLVLYSWHSRCSVNQTAANGLYKYIVEWMSANPDFRAMPRFNATDVDGIKAGVDGIDFADDDDDDDDDDENGFRAKRQAGASYGPDISSVSFWYKGAYFWFQERVEMVPSSAGHEYADTYLDVYSWTWNRSNQPIKDFLSMVKADHEKRSSQVTPIYSAQMGNYPYRKGRATLWNWDHTRNRAKRPLNTVMLDRRQMEPLVGEIKAFLSCQGVRWHKERGLPLRLGYLFHGPPGAGKSSLAFALAGKFNLPVYLLNISAAGLSDAGIDDLFADLPFHCIVMIEDIDATRPMKRGDGEDDDDDDDDEEEPEGPGPDMKKLPWCMLEWSDGPGGSKKQQQPKNDVTLTALLNAIDGIGASEGRILIMTTNRIQDVDEALIRPGRADRIVRFTNTTKAQARDMFIGTYTRATRWAGGGGGVRDEEDWTDREIAALAARFAARLPDRAVSPALLLQYFKDFRDRPRLALRQLDAWMRDPRAYRRPLEGEEGEEEEAASLCESYSMLSALASRGGAEAGCSATGGSLVDDDLISMHASERDECRMPGCFDVDCGVGAKSPHEPLVDFA